LNCIGIRVFFWKSAMARKGFTLVEMLITVVIIGILAAVAIPAYKGTVAKSSQSDAKAQLTAIRQAQEVYRFQNGSYATQAQRTSLSGWKETSTRYGYFTNLMGYTFSITASVTSTFTAQATGNVFGTQDTWTIDQDGNMVHTQGIY